MWFGLHTALSKVDINEDTLSTYSAVDSHLFTCEKTQTVVEFAPVTFGLHNALRHFL